MNKERNNLKIEQYHRNTQFNLTSTILTVSLLLGIISCSTKETIKNVQQESNSESTPTTNPFEKIQEGFIDSNTFQVVVSSLKTEPNQAESEARIVAEKKSFQMLQTYPQKPLSNKGRIELKDVSESGKIVQRGKIGDKKYFVYQIQRSGLKLFVENHLP